jgi:hypothetical protein
VEIEIEFSESSHKHGVSEEDIRSAMETFLADGTFEDDPEKFLLIGFDTKGNLIEVMYNYSDKQAVFVFHAMKCRKEYLSQIGR